MRVSVPEYVKPIASAGNETVLSTPAWYAKHGADQTVFVDARSWPPQIVVHPMRVMAAARLPDGRWACVAGSEADWSLSWFAGIAATAPVRSEALPVDPERECGIEQLVAFGDVLIAIDAEGFVHVQDGNGWHRHPTLKRAHEVQTVEYLDEATALEWGDALYARGFRALDARGCKQHVRVPGGPLLAVHDDQLVEVTPSDLIPRLPGHAIHALEPGPGGALWVTTARDDERGTSFDAWLFDPARGTVAVLTEALVGRFPKPVAFTHARGIVLHDDAKHELFECSAEQLAALPQLAASELPVPPRIELEPLDELGAASRPLVATTGDHIAIAAGRHLRLHTVDAPTNVVEHTSSIVGVAAARGRFAVLDATGLLLEYDGNGTALHARPTVAVPRSIAVAGDAWVVIGDDRVLIVGPRPHAITIAKPLAVAADPDGELVIVCEDHRLACWTGTELLELPPTREQLVAITALGDRRFACLGRRDLYLLDLRVPELSPLERRLRRPHLTSVPAAGRLAACSAPGGVEVDDYDGTRLVSVSNGSVRYSSYSAPVETDVTVHGLAFMDDGRLVIALDEGRANIVDPETGSALKLDPQPGDEPSRWIFFCGGSILIAG